MSHSLPTPALQADVGSRLTEDHFNRKTFATRLAQTIVQRESIESFVIGLYGAWGEGKTTVLDYMDEALQGNEDVVLVRFNPWLFSSDEALTQALIQAIAEGVKLKLQDDVEGAKRFGQAALLYGGKLAKTLGGLSGNAFLEKGGALAETVAEGMNPQDQTVHELKERVGGELRAANKKVVVLLDDIDRLTRQEIQQVFRLIKVAADFPTVTYVLAFDPEMVAGAVGAQYGSGEREDGQRFLEKIVQLPLQLPYIDQPSITEYTFNMLSEAIEGSGITLTEGQRERFVSVLEEDIIAAVHTPRQAKRYANAVAFALPILQGETNPVDVLLVEALRVLYPDMFHLVRSHSELFLNPDHSSSFLPSGEDSRVRWAAFFKEHDEHAVNIVRELFPKVSAFMNNPLGIYVSRAGVNGDQREQGVDKPRYFNRYFQYAISGDDVSDAQITQFLGDAVINPTAADALIAGVAPEKRASKFVLGIRDAIFMTPFPTQRAALLALAQAVPLFERSGAARRIVNPLDMILKLMTDLIEQASRADAEHLGMDLIDLLPPQFAMRFLYSLQPYGRSRVMSEEYDQHQVEIREALKRHLVERLDTMGENMADSLGEDYSRGLRLLAQVRGREAAEARLTRHLDAGRGAVVEFLAARSPTSGDAYLPCHFSEDNYIALEEIISMDRLLPYLNEHFPETLEGGDGGLHDVRARLMSSSNVATRDTEEAAGQIATCIRAFHHASTSSEGAINETD
ncbi:KAP family NTPase (plasmid) [Deinococcus sp. VB142]|uniref:KAP family NTPase n=1 Tax=Deinococcus sp. VB142 TaxID=3112952 RepID=A0AAU6Q981_9DEIO